MARRSAVTLARTLTLTGHLTLTLHLSPTLTLTLTLTFTFIFTFTLTPGTRIAVHGRHLSLAALAPPRSRARAAHTPPLTHTHPTHTHGTYVCGFGYAWPPLECWCPSDTTGEANQSSPPMAPARNRSANATGEVRCACSNSTAASLAQAGAVTTPAAPDAGGSSQANQTNHTNQSSEHG